MGIKDSTSNWVRGKPAQAMILVGALGLVIGGVIGLAGGYKIEQSRTKSDVQRLQQEIRDAQAKGVDIGGGPLGQRVGKVSAVKDTTLTLSTNKQGDQTVTTSANTAFESTTKGSTSDITVGSRLLVALNGANVIVLPKDSNLGRLVTAVGSETFSIARPKGGRPLTIKLDKVKDVSTTTPTDLSAVKVDAEILAGGRAVGKGSFAATEVILLPANNPFVS
jgi:hypothetical protein